MQAMSLVRLIRPIDAATFFDEIWERRARLFRSALTQQEQRAILDLPGLERTLASIHRPDDSWVQLARSGRRPLPPSMLDSRGMVHLSRLYSELAAGETIYLTKAELLCPAILRVCRAVELSLIEHGIGTGQPVGGHVFLTPPSSQGFPRHRDAHASFVLQLDGSKHWTVWDRTSEQAPSIEAGQVADDALRGARAEHFSVTAGDVLYVPPLWAHEARSTSTHSLHLTLRVFPLTWAEVLAEVCASHPALATAVPRGVLEDGDALTAALVARLDAHDVRQPLPRLLQTICRSRLVPDKVLPSDGLQQVLALERIALDTPLERRVGSACRVARDGERVSLWFSGGRISGPAAMETVFQFVAGNMQLCAADLPLVPSARYERLDVARMLVRDGLLRIMTPTPDAVDAFTG